MERSIIGAPSDADLLKAPAGLGRLVHVLPKPGVMDPVAQSALAAIDNLDDNGRKIHAEAVRTLKREPFRAWATAPWYNSPKVHPKRSTNT